MVNVHASLLPRHRGAAPINQAILSGDAETGVTIMLMDEQLDHGPILAQRSLPIGPETTAPALTAELAELGAALLVEVLADLERFPPSEQDHAAATLAPRLLKEDGELDWSVPAAEIDRRVRGLDPWPGTTATLADRPLKVLRGRPGGGLRQTGRDHPADSGDGLLVGTGKGAYLVEEVQLPSRRPMPARQLLP